MSSGVEDNSFTIAFHPNATGLVCFQRATAHGNALWIENSVETSLPAFALQFVIILSLNRILLLLSACCHVPRTVANILTGFLIGPSVLGRSSYFYRNLFPFANMMPFETAGAVMLVYYVFLVGLEVDLKPITRFPNKKAMAVAISGMVFTLPIGAGLYYLLVTDMGRKTLLHSDTVKHVKGAIMWGITLSCTSEFPEIAKILSDLKLLLTENGQLALTASLINDLFSWTLLITAITQFAYSSVFAVIVTLAVVVLCFYAVPPFVTWLFRVVGSRDRECMESQVVVVLHVVMVIGLVTDGLGVQSVTGAFFLGVVIPKGALNKAVQDKVRDFVDAFMMPLFFVVVGERFWFHKLADDTHVITVVVVVLLAFVAKIVCVFVVSWIHPMPLQEGLSLALLMNTKGTMSFIVLKTARDRLDLNDQTYGVMLLACCLMTVPVGPYLASATQTIASVPRAEGQTQPHKATIHHVTRPDSPLRVLSCVHTKRDANAILNLLKSSSPSVRCPIQVLAVELIKMTARPASSLIIRDARKPSFQSNRLDSFRQDTSSGDTLAGFENLSQAIFAEKMRVISNYSSMHKDILNLAKRRGVNLILTTLNKQPTYDGLGAGTATARAVNIINRDNAIHDEKKVVLENVVKEATCCLGIFVDRGLSQRNKELQLAMIYVSGGDDREALSYAWRMSRNQEVQLTVVRLVWENPNDEFDETDREYIKKFVQQTADMPKVRYLEKVVKDEKETVMLLNKIGNKGFDLYIVGRGHGRKMSLAQTVDPVLEEPALGPLGDALTDLNSAAETSILIFQRHGEFCDGNGKHVRNGSSYGKIFDSMIEQQFMHPTVGHPPLVFGLYT